MLYFDFTNYELSGKAYGGSEKKLGIIISGFPYMLKFQKKTPFSVRYNTISEYLGSHIYQMLGFDCQETYLGEYKGEKVVACKDFVINNYQFVPFNDVGESTIEEDKEQYQYSYEDIMSLLASNKKMTNVEETISSFFEIFIVDALLGNFDRHGGNWGFLKKDNKYYLAPVFDNGSCLFPNMTNEDEMETIVKDQEQINLRVYKFPTSQIKLHGKKSSYFEVISSLEFEEINKALLKICPLIDMKKIYDLIDDIQIISDSHKEFYKTMIKHRYDKIIKYSYEKLTGKVL
ncbi:MAG: HipA domain-containing protein [Bacilli bacterium]|jgi:hypothetical protein|nr:HipA domain-containing protein [Bacilli bacterium]